MPTLSHRARAALVAAAILAGGTVVVGGGVARAVRAASVSSHRATATELAADRLAAARRAPAYAELAARFDADEPTVPGHPGYRRSTVVTRVAGPDGREDYSLVTVVVSHSTLDAVVRKTAVVRAF